MKTLQLFSTRGISSSTFLAVLLFFSAASPFFYGLSPWEYIVPWLYGHHLIAALPAAAIGVLCAWGMCLTACGQRITLAQMARNAAIPYALAVASQTHIEIWQAPTQWLDVLYLSPLCATFIGLAHILVLALSLARKGRHPSAVAQISLFLSPFVFNWLLVLQAPALLQQLGASASAGLFSLRAQELLGRIVVLAGFNTFIAVTLNALCTRTVLKGFKPYALLLGCAAYAGLTPLMADLGTSATVTSWPAPFNLIGAILAVALAQAGLWAETFLVTGLLMDALKERKPTGYWGARYFREGVAKGAVYSALFLSLLFLTEGFLSSRWTNAVFLVQPLLMHVLLGALCMPLAKTILESFDGSRPFHLRLANSYHDWKLYPRGVVLGLGLYLLPVAALSVATPGMRFVYGALLGALAYGGVTFGINAWEIMRGRRQRLESWRIYLTGVLLGGFVGGAIAWYVDASQSKIILDKFHLYVTLRIDNPQDYIIYPLFSKWGAMNLGPHSGSARILFNESVSGVINWSLAAPLFSVNFFVLTALFTRSMAPIRMLLSPQGIVAIAEQTVRVLRWGLWMAPVIYSLLRISGDPTWYNQDGAFRTLAALWQSLTLSPEAFHGWSVETFMYLLAYDWFRILIWLDHMGLRVATLVNLSFVGGDVLDELLARFQGHPGRTRCIPEALRRFATWAPLLIPFFLPMGADWAYVWDTAEAIQKTGQGLASPLLVLVVVFGFCAVLTTLLLRLRAQRQLRLKADMVRSCGLKVPGFSPPDEIILHNGVYTVVQGRDGRGYSRVFSAIRHGEECDLTNRPESHAHNVGKFIYLREADAQPWTLGCRPARRTDARTSVHQVGPLHARMSCACQGIVSVADITLHENATVETCRLRITNTTDQARSLVLTTYREVCLNDPNPQLRHPFYTRQHVGTWFVPQLRALFARNRLLKTTESDATQRRPSPEVYFHAAHVPHPEDAHRITLAGYEDNRRRFIGDETLRNPNGLSTAPLPLDDCGLHYPFDPMASLRLNLELAPGQTIELLVVDGYAESAAEGTRLLCSILGLPAMDVVHPHALESNAQEQHAPTLESMLHPEPTALFRFSDDGQQVITHWKTPRRWGHIMANELGYGLLATNDGGLSSFMGNCQQNAITPFAPDTMTTQTPGQIFYLRDRQSGEIFSPTYIPFRDKSACHEVVFGLGHAIFRMTRPDIRTELTAFVSAVRPMEGRILRIENPTDTAKTYTVTFCAQIVLAQVPVDSVGHIQTAQDQELSALFFENPENRFHHGWAFVASSLPVEASETSLNHFLGEGRDFTDPVMVTGSTLNHRLEDDGYRVAVLQGTLTVPAHGQATMHVLLGQDQDIATCSEHIRAFARTADLHAALARTIAWWQDMLGAISISTSSPAFDRLINTWLPYQVLTARLWGRLGPHQRSGAYGFRDQLQDALPFVYLRPELARNQILMHAGRQFREGDVLQWWHQTWDGYTGLGMRNRASDPHLWLTYLTCRYVEATGDMSILDEAIPLLEGRSIPHGEEGIAFIPRPSRDTATVYEHCLLAVDRTLERLGANGLPLMGAHDWNDGLSAVGVKGKGTSVWLGFFLHDALRSIAPLMEQREGRAKADHYRDKAARLRDALQGAWKEDHFLRALMDSGQPLDYADALCASWPLLSGVADTDQGATALRYGLRHLEKDNLILLLHPFFDENSTPYPGRIADYPPGVRENGGQYSHGASWLVDALAVLAQQEAERGQHDAARHWRDEALRVWLKISPLAHTLADEIDTYGLPPHQQCADIFYGPGYEGRGGWSWYTGAAARMLWAAYAMLGFEIRDGKPRITEALLGAESPLKVQRICVHGQDVYGGPDEEK